MVNITHYLRCKDESEANPSPDINGLRVGGTWHPVEVIEEGSQDGHSQECCAGEEHAGSGFSLIDPEADPRQYDEHATGNVDLDEVVVEFPLERQVHPQAAVLS